MCGITGSGLFYATILISTAGLTAFGQKDESSLKDMERSQPEFPKQCAGFLKTERTRLASVWGNHERIDTILATSFSIDRRYALVSSVRARTAEDPPAGEDEPELICFDVTLWDTTTHEAVRSFSGVRDRIVAMSFSPDRKQALTGGADGVIRLWDLATGKELRASKPTDTVYSLAFSPDGKQALAGTMAGSVSTWAPEGGKLREIIKDQGAAAVLVAFLPGGEQALTVWADGEIRTWALKNGRRISSIQVPPLYSACPCADGKRIVIGTQEGPIHVWDLSTGKEIVGLKGHEGNVLSVVDFSPDGSRIVSCGDDQTLRVWDAKTGKEILVREGVSVTSVAFSGEGKRLLGSSPSGFATLDLATGEEIEFNASHRAPVSAVAFAAGGKSVLSGGDDGTLRRWEVASGKQRRRFANYFAGLAVSADGKLALAGCADHALRLWDTETGKHVRTFIGHDEPIVAVALSADAKLALSASQDQTVRLWDATSGKALRRLSGHVGEVTSIGFSPDGKYAVTGGEDARVRLWSLNDTSQPLVLKGHKREVTTVAFSSDGKQILSGSKDRTLRLWDAATGEETRTFARHQNRVTSAAFSPDGKRALSTSDDCTVKLWDVATGRELDEIDLSGSPDVPTCLAFAPDGKSFVVGTSSWVVLRFEITR